MNLFYLGNSCFEENLQEELLERKLIQINATRERERYIFSQLLKLEYVDKFNFISFGLGEKNGVFRKVIINNGQFISTFLGYAGISKIKYLSGLVTATAFLISRVKSGDILISYNIHPGYAIAIFLLKLFKKVTFIIEFEDFFHKNDFRYYFLFPFEKLGLKLADKFIASSIGMKNYLKSKEPQKKCVVHSGYRTNSKSNMDKITDINNKTRTVLNQSQPIKILYSGSLDKARGVIDLIENFVYRASSQFELIITGRGPLEKLILEKAATYSNIKFYGLLSNLEYEKLLNESYVCVSSQHPSIKLNFPSKITKYLSDGKLVLSTKGDSVLKSKFASLIYFYDYGNPLSFWEVIEN
tara:strand:- start:2490 stop:3554 length:1065 start_codon:yes stop_codon:yes gene_type:complete